MYHHRARHNVVIAGDYLYIDGGEVSTWNGIGNGIEGYSEDGDIVNLPDNSTYSIDLSSSWTNKSVKLNTISKLGAPVLSGLALWPDASDTSFYAYDGGISRVLPARELPDPPANSLWKFIPAASSGTWQNMPLQPNSNFTSLIRLELCAYASGNGMGFAMGGYRSSQTDNTVSGFVPTPGMIMYNTTSQEWLNVSTFGYSGDGVSTNAAAWFVPNFGPKGLLAVLGGQGGNDAYYSTDYISFFDMVTQSWRSQRTSGMSPAPSNVACVVGTSGDNGTYEIFYYGGLADDIDNTISNNVVHVLSLPSFNWQKESRVPTCGRLHHHCVAKSRQMISVGGIVKTKFSESVSPGNSLADPLTDGLGVFDMSAMEWKNSYDADAAPYVTPDIVKAYYLQHGQFPESWDSPEIERWFTQKDVTAPINSSSHEPAASHPSHHHHHQNTGAIAGGVVAGVSALILAAAVIFLYRRYCSRSRNGGRSGDSTELHDGPERKELDSRPNASPTPRSLGKGHLRTELSSVPPVYEVPNNLGRQHLDGQQVYEMHS